VALGTSSTTPANAPPSTLTTYATDAYTARDGGSD